MNSRKRIMIVGASYSQIPLMEAARRLGCHVIAVSIPGPYQGFSHADEAVFADITKPGEVLAAAREKEIDAICGCCMDLGMESVGYVNEKLHLHGPRISAALAARDKSVEKEAYRKAGVRTAPFFPVHSTGELHEAVKRLRFPIILKAVDQMGSRGICRADTEDEADAAFRFAMNATSRDFCIAEEYLQGKMFGVEAMVSGGKLAYVLPLGNDQRSGNPPFPVGHFVPWDEGERMRGKIEELTEGVVNALGFDDCAVDLDCMYLDGEVWVIEATARAGATCITDTVGIYYGIDYYEAIVKAALGMDVCGMFRHAPRTASVTRLLSADREGTVRAIQRPEILPPQVRDLSFNIQAGSRVRPMQNGRDRIGQLIVAGSTVSECRKIQQDVLSRIRLEYEL